MLGEEWGWRCKRPWWQILCQHSAISRLQRACLIFMPSKTFHRLDLFLRISWVFASSFVLIRYLGEFINSLNYLNFKKVFFSWSSQLPEHSRDLASFLPLQIFSEMFALIVKPGFVNVSSSLIQIPWSKQLAKVRQKQMSKTDLSESFSTFWKIN